MPDTATGDHLQQENRWQRGAVTIVFLAHGVVFASWAAHIPQVKAHLGLTDATLGLALLGPPAGSVSAMVLAGFLLPRVGSRRLVQVALSGYCLAGCLVGLAPSVLWLFAALALWGAFQGALDVSMNTQAIAVEQSQARPLMFGFHGGWSIGAFVGAGIGVLAVALGVSLTMQLLVLGLVTLAGAWVLSPRLLPDRDRKDHRGDTGAVRGRALAGVVLALGAIAFASMLCEGAAADWSAVYLRGTLHRGASVSGLGYAFFALAIVIVRLSGRRLLDRTRARTLLPALAAVATVGFGAGLLAQMTIAALLGFAALGVGVALVVPAVFSAAGRIPGLHPGTAMATVSACGWAGFMVGPPLVGQLASPLSLPAALGLVPVLTAFIAVAIGASRALDRIGGPGGPGGPSGPGGPGGSDSHHD
jgi:hypothetical protein